MARQWNKTEKMILDTSAETYEALYQDKFKAMSDEKFLGSIQTHLDYHEEMAMDLVAIGTTLSYLKEMIRRYNELKGDK